MTNSKNITDNENDRFNSFVALYTFIQPRRFQNFNAYITTYSEGRAKKTVNLDFKFIILYELFLLIEYGVKMYSKTLKDHYFIDHITSIENSMPILCDIKNTILKTKLWKDIEDKVKDKGKTKIQWYNIFRYKKPDYYVDDVSVEDINDLVSLIERIRTNTPKTV